MMGPKLFLLGLILVVANAAICVFTGDIISLVFAGVIAIVLYFDPKIFPPEEK